MYKILMIGCGRMGSAMLEGWLKRDDIAQIDVIDRHVNERTLPNKVAGFTSIDDWAAQKRTADIAILAIKPQSIADVSASIAAALAPDTALMSVAVGVTLTRLANLFGDGRALIRTMPNTPSALGKGVTGYTFNARTSEAQKALSVSLLTDLGLAVHLEDEGLMDALAAISGSGPAYYYLFTEAMRDAGIALGLPDDVATQIARHTLIGAGALLEASPQAEPQDLRAAVTSPGGTTAAAIQTFESEQALGKLVKLATQAAVDRANVLSQSS